MHIDSSRRQFFGRTGAIAAGVAAAAWRVFGQTTPVAPQAPTAMQTPPPRRSEALPDALVNEWVWRGHFDPDGVKRMLSEHPTLLNAEYDWGSGDYELAIGGAGHMGRRDIAEYLLGRGARMDVFVATMLGRLDVVKATLTAYPALLASTGPHGLTFLHHARQGGAPAREVFEYLESLGAK
jgi:hypothetical protein